MTSEGRLVEVTEYHETLDDGSHRVTSAVNGRVTSVIDLPQAPTAEFIPLEVQEKLHSANGPVRFRRGRRG